MVVDDSVLIRKYVTQVLSEIPDIEVIATAPNGKIALKKVYLYHPDLIILDLEMPEMTGMEFLKYLRDHPDGNNRPAVIILSSIATEGSAVTFEALSLGAQDFITKPQGQVKDNVSFLRQELDLKIHSLRRSEYVPAESQVLNEPDPDWEKTGTRFGLEHLSTLLVQKTRVPRLVAVGSSTGGPHALRKILETLGPLSVPLLIAQHMPPTFTREFALNLSANFQRDVREASDGEKLENGIIYICPGGFHSRVQLRNDCIHLECDPREIDGFFFKPSVDIFFASIADSLGGDVLGVILSGMGKDGSAQSPRLRSQGAVMLAQDKASSVVWGMPGNSVKANGIDLIVPLADIGTAINRVLQLNQD